MNNSSATKLLSILLVLCVLSVGGVAQAQAAEHAWHHVHHQAATHGTVFCTWMCEAGQGWEQATTPIPFDLIAVGHVELSDFGRISIVHAESPASRGPPVR